MKATAKVKPKATTKPNPIEISVPAPVRLIDPRHQLQQLLNWCNAELVEAQHGTTSLDPGRASAYSRTVVKIREMQGIKPVLNAGRVGGLP